LNIFLYDETSNFSYRGMFFMHHLHFPFNFKVPTINKGLPVDMSRCTNAFLHKKYKLMMMVSRYVIAMMQTKKNLSGTIKIANFEKQNIAFRISIQFDLDRQRLRLKYQKKTTKSKKRKFYFFLVSCKILDHWK